MHFFLLSPFISLAAAVLVSGKNGPYPVSVFVEKLTDSSRLDPYAPIHKPHPRNLMVSLFMPVNSTISPCRRKLVPYMTPAVAAGYDSLTASIGLPNNTFATFEVETCRITPRYRYGCGGSNRPAKYPLLVFSPGLGQSRLVYGLMARSLASHGYAVVTIDHPYDAAVVEFPDGTVIRNANISTDDIKAIEKLSLVRAADASFVIHQLKNSSTFKLIYQNHRASIDLNRIVMFGHSLGGATTAAAMLSDPRILGGVDIDGRIFNPVLEKGLDRPFLLLGRPNHGGEDKTWGALGPVLRGGRVEMAVAGSLHGTFTDFPVLFSHLNISNETRDAIKGSLGNIPAERMTIVLVEVLTAFCDFVFGLSAPRLFQRGDSRLPELTIVKTDI